MQTLEFWSGEFGDAYVDRCRVDWTKRKQFWRDVIPNDVESVLEVGCNAGWNLRAMPEGLDCVGVDINEKALLEARDVGCNVYLMAAHAVAQLIPFDLVFTAGVLIHVATQDLQKTMAAIIEASKRYVICVEYAHPQETEVTYRGHEGKLWKRPYGQLYEAMGLKLDGFGFVGEKDGFDNCAWWRYVK